MRFLDRAATPLGRLGLAVLGCVLCAPASTTGLVLDDYLLAERLRAADGTLRWPGLLDAFSFVPRAQLDFVRELGLMPWWTDPHLKLSFFRPLSAFTHGIDFQLFKDLPWMMHLESLALLLALTLTVGAWYSKLFAGSPRALALAFSLYALAPGHGFAASWIANRNSVLATLFAILCLIAHDRSVGRGRRFQIFSIAALAASLLSSELGLSTLALLVAHATTLDARPLRTRLLALAPAVLVCTAWLLAYVALGYGADGSSFYIDPVTSPLGYLRALCTNVPILLFAQWVFPVASLTLLLSRTAMLLFSLSAVLCVALLARAVVPLLRCDARARFCALASLLALLPVAATVPHDRLLILSDIGGFGLVALTLERAMVRQGLVGHLTRGAALLRFLAAMLLTPAYAASLHQYVEFSKRPFQNDMDQPQLREQSLVFLNAPCVYFAGLLPALRRFEGGPLPRRVRTLAPGIYPLDLWRTDARTLVIRSDHGLLQPAGTWPEQGTEQVGPVSAVYGVQALNFESSPDRHFERGDRVSLSDVDVEIVEVTDHALPRVVRFHFAAALEDARFRFLIWHEGGFHPFTLPALYKHVHLAAELR